MKMHHFASVLLFCAFAQTSFADSEGERGNWDRIEKMRKESEVSLASLSTLFEVYRQDGTGLDALAEKVKAQEEILGRLQDAYLKARLDHEGWAHFVEGHPEHTGRSHWEYFSNIALEHEIAFGHMAGREADFKRSGWEGFSLALRDARFSLGKMAYYDPGCHLTGEETVMCAGEVYKRVRAERPLESKNGVAEERLVENEK